LALRTDLPQVVIPTVELSITTGMNALAHAIKALYATDANPVIFRVAKEGIKALLEALPVVHSLRNVDHSPVPGWCPLSRFR
jgi:alcohol dehydrogenase class IV